MSDQKKPYVSPELLAWLESNFPDRAPSPSSEVKDIWIAVGQVEVVRHLKRLAKDQKGV
jgi:hypothetical protein